MSELSFEKILKRAQCQYLFFRIYVAICLATAVLVNVLVFQLSHEMKIDLAEWLVGLVLLPAILMVPILRSVSADKKYVQQIKDNEVKIRRVLSGSNPENWWKVLMSPRRTS